MGSANATIGVEAVTVADRADLSTSATSPNDDPAELADQVPVHGDGRLSAFDDEEVEAVQSLRRDCRALGKVALDELVGETLDRLLVEIREERHAFDQFGRWL